MNTEESVPRRTEVYMKLQLIKYQMIFSTDVEGYKATFIKILNQYRDRAVTPNPDEGCNTMEEYNNSRYIYEFKLNETAEKAMEALLKYKDKHFVGDDIICIGINYEIDVEDKANIERTCKATWIINWYGRDQKLKKHFPQQEYVFKGAVDTHLQEESIEEHYEFVDKIAFGCTSTVFKVKHKKTGEIYAAKVVNITQNYGFHGKEETLREMKLMNQLNHPKIVHLYEAFEYKDKKGDPKIALIIDYLGGDLIIEKRRNISEKLLKHYVRQTCDALRYIHERLIFHHDIERNVMCVATDSDDVKVIDFGLSMQTDNMETEKGIFPNVGGWYSDIYSLGSMMYYLVSGIDAEQHIKYSEEKALTWSEQCFRNLSEECLNLMKKLMVKDRKKQLNIRQVMSHPWLMRKD